jgi:hypothetical protein
MTLQSPNGSVTLACRPLMDSLPAHSAIWETLPGPSPGLQVSAASPCGQVNRDSDSKLRGTNGTGIHIPPKCRIPQGLEFIYFISRGLHPPSNPLHWNRLPEYCPYWCPRAVVQQSVFGTAKVGADIIGT